MKRYCLALDLQPDPVLISQYEKHHQNVWPEVEKSILNSGILHMEIYRFSDRLFMIMDTDDTFSFEKKAILDSLNAVVQEWEEEMWKYQKPLPGSKPGEKWQIMTKIFELG